MHSRRQILQGLGAAAGAAMLPRVARASLDPGPTPMKILQIFLHGAPAHSQTLWMPGEPDIGWVDIDTFIPSAVGAHPFNILTQNEHPGLDHSVNLGAGFHPLLSLGGASRTHLVALDNPFNAHLLAASYALSGINIGNPDALSLGARVQQAWGVGGFPKSWVLDPVGNANLTSLATAIGSQAENTRPFVLPVGRPFVSRLQRQEREHTDSLLAYYQSRYAQRLQHSTGPVRAPAVAAYEDARARMAAWQSTYEVLADGPNVESNPGGASYTDNRVTRSVQMGLHLLANGARCVTVLGDGGAAPSFDTHDFDATFDDEGYTHDVHHSAHHNAILWGICEAIRTSPDLDLTNTVIVVHSEFGRRLDGNDGSEHWNEAFAALLFGGPIQQPGISGALSYQTDGTGNLRSHRNSDDAYAPVPPDKFLDGLATLAGSPPDLDWLGQAPPPPGPIFQNGANP